MFRRLSYLAWLLPALCLPISLLAQSPQPSETRTNYVVEVTATTSPTPPHITLHWPAVNDVDNTFKIYRRPYGSSAWDPAVSLPGSPTGYQDLSAQRGVIYEYSVRASRTYPAIPTQVHGQIVAGSDVPLVEERGKVLLYIDQTQVPALDPELDQLERNLVADGWKVYRHLGPRGASDINSNAPDQVSARIAETQAMRAAIQSYYNAEPGDDWSLLIIGGAPVAYSGASAVDGHPEHYGAWPTDTFYGDVDGVWTDTTVNTTQADARRNHNLPGDGKYDQTNLPSDIDLQVGRVDLRNMEAASVGLTETELLRQYLVRDHRFRHGLAPYDAVARRGLIDDTFDGGDMCLPAWCTAIALFGREPGQVDPLDWFSVLPHTPMLFAFGGGGGFADRARDVGTTVDFGTKGSKAVFTLTFGSWFGDWDVPDNFLRAPLAGTAGSLGLTNAWSGAVFLQSMAMGETVGESMRFSQNYGEDTTFVGWRGGWSGGQRRVHRGLMGDPTLRLHTVRPPTRVTATALAGDGGVLVSWQASPDATEGYHVYRAVTASGPFVRLTGVAATGENPTGSPVAGDSWTDTTAAAGESHVYLVKAVKMETSASGTYANQSLGRFASISLAPTAPTGLSAVATGTTSYQLTWHDNAVNETGYLVERRDPATGEWSAIATLPADSNDLLDTNAPAGVVVHYRVRAAGSGTDSDFSDVAADYTLPGVAISNDWHRNVLSSWDGASLGVRRFNGDRGAVEVAYTTSDVLSTAGVDYVAETGTLAWAHGDAADAQIGLSLPASPAPKLTRIFKVGYSSPTNGLGLGFPAETFVQIQDPAVQTLPSGWQSLLIGSAAWAGYAEYKDGVFGLAARTSKFGWGNRTDSFRFAYVPVAGDVTLTARLRTIVHEMNPSAQAGVMLRASLAGNAVMRGILMPSQSQAYQFSRLSTGGETATNTVNIYTGYQWLRVRRVGDVVSTFRSVDGNTWIEVGSAATLPLSSTAYVGFMVSTNTDFGFLANPAYAQFDNVTIDAALTVPASLVAAPGASPGEIALTWGAVPGALSYEVQRSTSAGSGFVTIASVDAASASHMDTGLVAGVPYHYRVRAVNALAQSGYSAEASAEPYLPADYIGWRYVWFATNDTDGLAADAADPDGDGVPNIAEYASGGSPIAADTAGRTGGGTVAVGGEDYLTLTFVRDTDAGDVVHTVESADDLAGAWSGFNPLLPANQLTVQADAPAPGLQTITVRDTQPLSASARRFMRLRRAWQDPVWRVFATGFEAADGDYVLNASLKDKTDHASGTSWSIPAGWAGAGVVSASHPKSGSRAWRILDANTSGAIGATLDAGPAVAGFIASRPWTFKVSFSLAALPVGGTGNQFTIALGQATASSTGKQWLRFLYNNGGLDLMVRSAGATAGTSATQTAVTLGQYADFAELGDYITLELTVDPVAKRYTAVRLSGPKSSADRTAAVQAASDGVIPWGNTTLGDPASHLLLNSTTPVTLTLDIDDLSLAAVPAEPATP